MLTFRKSRIWMQWLAATICLGLMSGMIPAAFAEEALELDSEAAILMDADTGQILFEKNSDREMYPASITKIMTGMLALKNLDPQQVLTVSEDAVNAVPRTSSHISLAPGDQLTVEQAMYALAMVSANDAANVLAEAVSGNLEDFAQLMTEEAVSLGTLRTNFVNANGLPSTRHFTTAYDMALITAAALQVPGLGDYFRRTTYECPPTNPYGGVRTFQNPNQMLSGPFSEDVLLTKTGWTTSAQGTLVVAARQGDRTLIAVVMKSILTESKYQDAVKLLDFGFSRHSTVTVTGEEIGDKLGLEDYIPEANQQVSFLLPEEAELEALTYRIKKLSRNGSDTATVFYAIEANGQLLAEGNLNCIRKMPEPESAIPVLALFLQEEAELESAEDSGMLTTFGAIILCAALCAGAVWTQKRPISTN